MANNLICRYGLNQLDLVICLEVCHLVSDLAYDLEIGHREHKLDVDVD